MQMGHVSALRHGGGADGAHHVPHGHLVPELHRGRGSQVGVYAPQSASMVQHHGGPQTLIQGDLLHHPVRRGADRQDIHEAIRRHSVEVTRQIKLNGAHNDLFDRILSDPVFGLTREDLEEICDVNKFTGLAEKQTEDFLENNVQPVLERYADLLGITAEVRV